MVSCNFNCTMDIPGREVEVIRLISASFRNFCSIFSVTKASTRSALAPGNKVSTLAIRLVIRGSSVRGSVDNDPSPATMSKIISSAIRRLFSVNALIISYAPRYFQPTAAEQKLADGEPLPVVPVQNGGSRH